MKRNIIYILSCLYVAILLYIVFFAERRARITEHTANLYLTRSLIFPNKGLSNEANDVILNYSINLIGNIILFIPMPIISISLFYKKNILSTILFCILISFLIELIQYTFKLGVADIDDILLNTVGIAIGMIIINYFRHN